MAQPKAISIPNEEPQEVPALFNRLLAMAQNASSSKELIAGIIEPLGQALIMDRVYVFSLRKEDGVWIASQLDEWVTNGITSELNNPELENVDMTQMLEIIVELEQNKLYYADVDTHPNESLKEILQAQLIKSVLFAPIMNKSQLWGFIGFDDCTVPREWSQCG